MFETIKLPIPVFLMLKVFTTKLERLEPPKSELSETDGIESPKAISTLLPKTETSGLLLNVSGINTFNNWPPSTTSPPIA